MKKQKLLYIIHGIHSGGAELAFLSALEDLEKVYDFRAIVLGRSNAVLLAAIHDSVRSRITCYPYPLPILLLYLPAIVRSIRSFSPDIMISSLWRSVVPAIWYKRINPGVRYIAILHINKFFHVADKFFTKRALRQADIVFADSEATKRFAGMHSPRGNEIQILSFLTAKRPKEMTNPPFSEKKFCFVGRLHKMKNVPLAIKAIGWLREQGIDARLDIYGRDDGDCAAVKQTIQTLGLESVVRWRGEFVPENRAAVFSKYNFYIQLSSHEGMAMSVVEAMQHGLVCFVTPVGEIPAYITDMEDGVLVDVSERTQWESTLERIKQVATDENLCAQISEKSKRAFEKRLDFSTSLIQALRESTEAGSID